MVSSAMWCDWSNNTAVSRQARCSSRQLVNSLGTTGYTYAPICELRSIFTGVAGGLEHAFEILLSHENDPLPYFQPECSGTGRFPSRP